MTPRARQAAEVARARRARRRLAHQSAAGKIGGKVSGAKLYVCECGITLKSNAAVVSHKRACRGAVHAQGAAREPKE